MAIELIIGGAVGTGASYYRAADRARASAGRRQLPGEWGGATVAEWLDVFGPPLLARYAETAWPQTLVLDSTRFMVDNVRTGTQQLAFNVLGAYGYPAQGRGRVWALQASHHARAGDWEQLLRSLDITVPPQLVITDGAVEIRNAVRAVWPALAGPSFPQPFVSRCEHHLHVNGREAMDADGWGGRNSFLRRRVDTAFRRGEAFGELVEQAAGYPATSAWLTGIRDDVTVQVATRWMLPDHHSGSALDTALGRVRDFLDSRSFVLRNAARTNVLLGLVRNHLNGRDLDAQYRTQLRAVVDADGRAGAQRAAYDPRLDPRFPGRQLRYPGSLRI